MGESETGKDERDMAMNDTHGGETVQVSVPIEAH